MDKRRRNAPADYGEDDAPTRIFRPVRLPPEPEEPVRPEDFEAPEEEERTDPPEDGEEEEEEPSRRPGADLFELFQMVMGCVLAAVVLFNCFARVTRVEGGSMDNTLENGELMIIWSLGYHPKAGDIIVFNKKSTDFFGGRALVKRVIATGGQTVDIDYDTGTVYVDHVALDEPYIKEAMYRPGDPNEQGTHWEVPEGSVFAMGDNRNASSDGRHDALGTFDEGYILGKAVLSLWPMHKFGLL